MDANFDFGLYDDIPEPVKQPIEQQVIQKEEPAIVQQETVEPASDSEKEYPPELCKLFVGGLKKETNRDTMRSYFEKFGPVLECNVLRDPISQVSRGFGFVTFTNPKTLDRVLKQDHFLDDKILDTRRSHQIQGKQDTVEKIFVGGLPLHIDNDLLKEYFEGFGTVLDARVMLDKQTGESRGFAFVTFEDVKPIKEVLEKQIKTGIRIGGKRVEIKYSNSKQLLKKNELQQTRKRTPSVQVVQEIVIKIPRYDEGGNPFGDPRQYYVMDSVVHFQKVQDGDEIVPKRPFDHPLEDVVDLSKYTIA